MRSIAAMESGIEARWAHFIPVEQWNVYSSVMLKAEERGISFAIGGGTAFSHYSDRWRNSKDLDLYVLPADREAMIHATKDAGLTDYFDVLAYDRGWIYRSHDAGAGEGGHGVIVDIMWQMANYRGRVDERWLTAGDLVQVRGMQLRLLPPEELVWAKLYILQRDRCDWGDLLNILFSRGARMDWKHMLEKVGEDQRVLAALLEMFAWACPGRAGKFPPSLWESLAIRPPEAGAVDFDPERIRVLDSRDWFGPNMDALEKGPPP